MSWQGAQLHRGPKEAHVVQGVLLVAAPVSFIDVHQEVLWAQLSSRATLGQIHVLEACDFLSFDQLAGVLLDDLLTDTFE